MSKKTVIKHTTSYEDNLVKRLKDPELAQAYLEAALESYKEDQDTGSLLLALRDVAKAQAYQEAKQAGLDKMTMEEIDELIKRVREQVRKGAEAKVKA